MEDTRYNIMKAAMDLVMEKGYGASTTKDIAALAGVNECTLFRKFKTKQDIILSAMDQKEWCPVFTKEMFLPYTWDLETDLVRFSKVYLETVTTGMVLISIGLRSPQLYEHTAPKILKVPQVYKTCLQNYLKHMMEKGNVKKSDADALATAFLAMNFGFVFFKASFGNKLTSVKMDDYINTSVKAFVSGIAG